MVWEHDANRQTQLAVEAGEILQILSPTAIGTLTFVIDDAVEFQKEMATRLGCSPSTITSCLQSLEGVSVALVRQRGGSYEITSVGETAIGILDRAMQSLGVNIFDVDWGDTEEKERLESQLSPLHSFRSVKPFLLLCSLSEHSAASQPVRITTVVEDTISMAREYGQRTTDKQVKSTIARFEEAGDVEYGDDLVLTKKGRKHVRLLTEFMQLFDNSRTGSTDGSLIESEPDSTTDRSVAVSDTQPVSLGHSDEMNQPIVPTYCLSGSDLDSENTPTPVVPITPTTTVDDLFERLLHLKRTRGGDADLELNWLMWDDAMHDVRNQSTGD